MAENIGNPWKVTAIAMALLAMALAIVTALVTGVVVANWKGTEGARPVSAGSRGVAPHAGRNPTPADIEACRHYAKSQVRNATAEVLKDPVGGAITGGGKSAGEGAAIGGVVAATAATLYGLNEASKNDARFAAAYRACLRGLGYAGAGAWSWPPLPPNG
ncbi:MAG: hypothetical protein HY726_20770 [Candidatus Rokubacteria bacterium]|nr:hypothetical protein [Candidatus Rokubacteria bacterium]